MSKKNTNEIKQKNNTKYSNKLLKLTIFIMVIITIILIGLFIMKRTGIIGNIQISSEKYGATTTDKTTNSTTGAEILDAEWSGPVTNFDYTVGVQTYTAPVSGTYKLEVWGAQGGSAYGTGGFGGYSQGLVTLEKGKNLYVSVGGHNNITGTTSATYNGGGQGWAWTDSGVYVSSGGGATSIQTSLIDNGEIEMVHHHYLVDLLVEMKEGIFIIRIIQSFLLRKVYILVQIKIALIMVEQMNTIRH